MRDIVEKISEELEIPVEKVIKEGSYRFLEIELKNIAIERALICRRYNVTSFENLWEKLEKGDISESECFDDLTRLEYLEIQADKFGKVMEECRL